MRSAGTPDYRALLQAEFDRRRGVNPSYSVRAFSRFLKISPAQLSQLLSGKRPLTAKLAAKISERLGYSPLQRAQLLESTVKEYQTEIESRAHEIREEEFRLIADWYHFAILSLSELRGSRSDARWIAARLGISQREAADAVQRLLRLKIIEVKGGRIIQVLRPIRTTSDIPSAAIRLYHQQNLDLSKRKLEEVGVNDREYSAITMPIARKKIPQAKKMITDFKRKLSALLADRERDAVYTLAIQLFPVTQLEEK